MFKTGAIISGLLLICLAVFGMLIDFGFVGNWMSLGFGLLFLYLGRKKDFVHPEQRTGEKFLGCGIPGNTDISGFKGEVRFGHTPYTTTGERIYTKKGDLQLRPIFLKEG